MVLRMSVVRELQGEIRKAVQSLLQTSTENDLERKLEGTANASHVTDKKEKKGPRIQVEITNDPLHGDIATNAAMVLCKTFCMSPRALAEKLAERLKHVAGVSDIAVAGPGFLNITLTPEAWTQELQNIVRQGEAYGVVDLGHGRKVQVEYVSANPTGPMHTGHVRNAVLGDAIAALLKKVGYDVYKEYYINNAGGQIDVLARSVYLRYLEALGHPLTANAFKGDVYPGDYLIPVGKALAERDGHRWVDQKEANWMPVFKDFAVQSMMRMIRYDLEELGVVMDYYASEKQITEGGKIEEALAVLERNGDLYTGVLTPPKGKPIDDWEARPQTLFKATKYGDEVDRPLRKSDGSWTYFAGDIAYHLDKFQRGFTYIINVLGADHCGYVTRLKAAVNAVTQGKATVDVKLFQLVNFFENGVPVKMSKRAGTFITSQDVVGRVGRDATRFMMLTKHNTTIIDFDFQKVLELSQENPVFYVQYAHARICSVFRHAQEAFPDLNEATIQKIEAVRPLQHQAEIALIKVLAQWPQVVEQAAIHLEPHRITGYLISVAGAFHSLWNRGKESPELRFIDPKDREMTISKLYLLSGVATILRDGLHLLGVRPVEEMH